MQLAWETLALKMGAKQYAIDCAKAALKKCGGVFEAIEETELYNQAKVLSAFQKNEVSTRHFMPTSGYGYDDAGRDTLDAVFADIFHTQDALVRTHFVSGSHAISLALFALCEQGTTLVSAIGKPYDTLEATVGISGDSQDTLIKRGVIYRQVELLPGGEPDINAILEALPESGHTILYVQRSRGYEWRQALDIEKLRALFAAAQERRPDVCILVDNCYGEFCEELEPTDVGADVIVGSLIKNPGGGLAPTGAYIAGGKEQIERCAQYLTAPGIGREVGSNPHGYTLYYQGLFMAPHVVAQALKTAVLFAEMAQSLGYETLPHSTQRVRGDIIQSIQFKEKQQLIDFCRAIQYAAPVDSFVTCEPWDMPGYQHPVIMAAGTFTQGASIELSADAPIKEPYTAYLQGALTFLHGILAAVLAFSKT